MSTTAPDTFALQAASRKAQEDRDFREAISKKIDANTALLNQILALLTKKTKD